MHFSKVSINNFRCFGSDEQLKFGIPNKEADGSGLTYLVGENNSGKTTVVESLWFKAGDYINDSDKKSSDSIVCIKYYVERNVRKEVRLARAHANVFEEAAFRENDLGIFEIVSSRRHWESGAAGSTDSTHIIQHSGYGQKSPRNQQEHIQTQLYLKDIERKKDDYEPFTKLIREVFPDFHGWSVGYENGEYIKYILKDGTTHRSDMLGAGVISVIRILAHLFKKRKHGLIIDEPELSLHPLAQKRLIKLIANYAKERQIVISTHSPYFVSWEYIKNGAALNKVVKNEDSSSSIYSISDFEKYKNLIKGENWQQPFLMDVVSKEIFFQDNVLFLEGQEDVGLLRNYFEDTSINLFGYGVRGYKNFELAFELAKDLGIKKASIIIDSPVTAGGENSGDENAIKTKLMEKFPEYLVLQWDKPDIRDKEPVSVSAKDGYFDKKGKIKDASELGDFNDKIAAVKKYFYEKASKD